MNIFTRIGTWVERHFPEKIIAADVEKEFSLYKACLKELSLETNSHTTQIQSIQNDLVKLNLLHIEVEKLRNELNMLKNLTAIKSRVVTPQISAFASRPEVR